MGMKEVLDRLVAAAVEAKKMNDFMAKNGYENTPYDKIYGQLADAIYYLIGENEKYYETFDQSFTYIMLNSKASTDLKSELLLKEYEKNKNRPTP